MATGIAKKRRANTNIIYTISSESEDETSNKKSRRNDDSPRVKVKATSKKRWPSDKNDKVEPLSSSTNDSSSHFQSTDYSDGCTSSQLPTATISSQYSINRNWTVDELLAERQFINLESSRNIVELFRNENTIPFICRYRRDLISNLTPEKLRDIKNSYSDILNLQKRSETVIKQLEKEKVLTDKIRQELLSAKTAEELEFLYAPYKPANKGSLADRAKALGLEEYAEKILYGIAPEIRLDLILNRKNKDLDSLDKVSNGIVHIISHIMSKSTEVLEELRKIQKIHRIVLKCTQNKTSASKKDVPLKESNIIKKPCGKNEAFKYELYFNFENAIRYIKPHQILAINRGEKAKYLNVKIIFPESVKHGIHYFIRKLFLSFGIQYMLRSEIFEKSFEECYSKKLQPLLTRQLRSDLSEMAKKVGNEVFAKNLRQLFLMSPLKGERILGIDPGFSNGCKLALISETAKVLETNVIYPHGRYGKSDVDCGNKLAKMLQKHNCRVIALGNGTACRETEFWLTKLFENNILDSKLIKYSIVSEQGASIYSCSEIAKKEFPNLDVNLISAVSIARRLNDPLSEYVKIEPRHIGVGMYQHDMNDKMLTESLNEVVTECVSYVGVDINTASINVLKHISGMTESRAEKIIDYRLKNGPFKTRKDLLKVKTIGEKTFVQSAGFIRIEPKSVGGKVENLLDCTWVHPESYHIAMKIISKLHLDLKNIGQPEFISVIKNSSSLNFIEKFSSENKIPKERIDIILEALQRELFQDYRDDLDKKPLFKQGITKMSDLKKGSIVSGAVTNITSFGAFVDIGIENDGLIHKNNMNGMILNIADRVEAYVLDVDIPRKRIQLRLENMSIET